MPKKLPSSCADPGESLTCVVDLSPYRVHLTCGLSACDSMGPRCIPAVVAMLRPARLALVNAESGYGLDAFPAVKSDDTSMTEKNTAIFIPWRVMPNVFISSGLTFHRPIM